MCSPLRSPQPTRPPPPLPDVTAYMPDEPGGLHGERWQVVRLRRSARVVCILNSLSGEYGCSGPLPEPRKARIWSARGRRGRRNSPPPIAPPTRLLAWLGTTAQQAAEFPADLLWDGRRGHSHLYEHPGEGRLRRRPHRELHLRSPPPPPPPSPAAEPVPVPIP